MVLWVLKLSQVDENHVYVDPSDSTYIEELDDDDDDNDDEC